MSSLSLSASSTPSSPDNRKRRREETSSDGDDDDLNKPSTDPKRRRADNNLFTFVINPVDADDQRFVSEVLKRKHVFRIHNIEHLVTIKRIREKVFSKFEKGTILDILLFGQFTNGMYTLPDWMTVAELPVGWIAAKSQQEPEIELKYRVKRIPDNDDVGDEYTTREETFTSL